MPKRDVVLVTRATRPSKVSKTLAAMMAIAAMRKSPRRLAMIE